MKNKVLVSVDSLHQHFGDQLSFLSKSSKAYDEGDTSEYKRLAITLRILFHETRSSRALINQVGLSNVEFASYAHKTNPRNLLTETNLLCMEATETGGKIYPMFAAMEAGIIKKAVGRRVRFETWWNEPVLRDKYREFFSRSDFVRLVADQDGGALVDPKIDLKYQRLLNENSIGWVSFNMLGEKPFKAIERLYIRQIAFEAALVLEPKYTKLIGNRDCDCNSGRKARYCCVKGFSFDQVHRFAASQE